MATASRAQGAHITLPARKVDAAIPPHRAQAYRLAGREAFVFESTRAGGASESVELLDDDLVVLELDNGLKIWTSGKLAREEYAKKTGSPVAAPKPAGRGARGGSGASGATGDVQYTLDAQLDVGSPSRGVVKWMLRALRIIDVDPVEAAAGKSAALIADKIEAGLVGRPGVYKLRLDAPLEGNKPALVDPQRLERIPGAGTEPILVFIHGTASSTAGSFGGLWSPRHRASLERLFRFYGGRVYGLEHRTLSVGPIENALDLAGALPDNAVVHLASHSRGGIVGELLCRANVPPTSEPFDADDRAVMQAAGRTLDAAGRAVLDKQAAQLDELSKLLRRKNIKVERFVRVGCPARGTTLASERLDRWISIALNALEAVAAVNPFAEAMIETFTELIAAVVKERLDPASLPGLYAQTPSSPVIKLLNRPDLRTSADLAVIAGDLDGEGILGNLVDLASRWFYGRENDLVVDTPSMYGGIGRAGALRFFDRGPQVNHFNYFDNAQTVERLVLGLAGTQSERAAKFDALEVVSALLPPRGARPRSRGPADGPIVFVLPGIMGSQLAVDGRDVWVAKLELMKGGMRRLALDQANVRPTEIDEGTYQALVDGLAEYGEVIPFPYDWRLSLEHAAGQLARAVTEALDRAAAKKRPVQFVAHSMGGLVVRTMIARHPEVWARACSHEQTRLVMLGTPNRGSHAITQMLLGRELLVQLLAMADFRNSLADILRIVKQFPGALELMPHGLEDGDMFARPLWEDLLRRGELPTDIAPSAESLAAAAAVRDLLAASPYDPSRMYYIAGCARATVESIEYTQDDKVELVATTQGDGRVLWSTGIPQGIERWYVDAVHGDIPKEPEVISACIDLLKTGDTRLLAKAPPASRAAAERFRIEIPRAAMHPEAADIAVAAAGGAPRAGRRRGAAAGRRLPPVAVSLVHGHLRGARFPLFVGHYEGDQIVNAEAEVDRQLRGRLTQRYRLGTYPGALGSNAVFTPAESVIDGLPHMKGGVVIGLGKVGYLSAGELRETFRLGVLAVVAATVEGRIKTARRADGEGIGVSTLIIGSNAGGIGYRDAVAAILRAVLEVNAHLERLDDPGYPLVRELEFIELYQDRAHSGFDQIATLAEQLDAERAIQPPAEITLGDGGLRRIRFDDDPPWWRQIEITAARDEQLRDERGRPVATELRFKLLTDLARAERYSTTAQLALVDRFIESATRTTRADSQISRTLFELLIPNALKEAAPRREKLKLTLDEAAAAFPWELLEDGGQRDGKPLVIESWAIRQLQRSEGSFRPRPSWATGNRVLVVGDTDTSDMRDQFAPLDGAQAEAKTVERVLAGAGFDVNALYVARPEDVLNKFFSGGYRIMHLAGHGVHDYAVPRSRQRISGMVLGGGLFLSAAEIAQMRTVPELVFMNCCYLGRMTSGGPRPLHKLAASIATQFIDNGVKCVIAAGWEVDDAAAKHFAETFYKQMCEGKPFAEAVHEARVSTFTRHADFNTWGAYQAYGDPDYRLATGGVIRLSSPRADRFATPEALVIELERLRQRASGADLEQLKRGLERLRKLREGCDARWLERHARVSEAFGYAFAAHDDFDAAIECFGRGMGAARADGSIAMFEQLINASSRQIASRVLAGAVSGAAALAEARAKLEASAADLAMLAERYPTVERLAILGSTYKRLAVVAAAAGAPFDEVLEYVDAARDRYRDAIKPPRRFDCYPASQVILCQLVSDWSDRQGLAGVRRRLDELKAELDKRPGANDFWSNVYQADWALLDAVHGATGGAVLESAAVLERYRAAIHLGANEQQKRSVLEVFDFLATMLAERAKGARGDSARAAHAASAFARELRQALGAPAAGGAAAPGAEPRAVPRKRPGKRAAKAAAKRAVKRAAKRL